MVSAVQKFVDVVLVRLHVSCALTLTPKSRLNPAAMNPVVLRAFTTDVFTLAVELVVLKMLFALPPQSKTWIEQFPSGVVPQTVESALPSSWNLSSCTASRDRKDAADDHRECAGEE